MRHETDVTVIQSLMAKRYLLASTSYIYLEIVWHHGINHRTVTEAGG